MKQTKQFLRPLLMAIVMMVGMLVPQGAWAQYLEVWEEETISSDASYDEIYVYPGGKLIINKGVTLTVTTALNINGYDIDYGTVINYGTIKGEGYINMYGGVLANHGHIDLSGASGNGTFYNTGTLGDGYFYLTPTECYHDDSEYLGRVDATCTHGAGTQFKCYTCHYIWINETGDPLPHDNHDHNGLMVCSVCGHTTYDAPTVGEGTAESPYQIANAGHLFWFADKVNNDYENFKEANAVLTADIVVNDGTFAADGTFTATGASEPSTPIEWLIIARFVTYSHGYRGTFDGQGHTISGLYANYECSGLVGMSSGESKIKNVGVTNSYFSGHFVGGICGDAGNNTEISNCYSSNVICKGNYVGGILGLVANTGVSIVNCYSTASLIGVEDWAEFGGITAQSCSTTNCYTTYGNATGWSESEINCEANVSLERFASGEIAYKLNGSVDGEGNWTAGATDGTQKWYQAIGTDAAPVFVSNGSNTVYEQKTIDCGGTVVACNYYNTEEEDVTLPHDFTSHTLTASPVEDGLYAYACDNGCGTHTDDHIIKDFNGEDNHLELTKDGEGNYSTSEDITLADANGFVSPVDFTAPSVTYTRTGIKNQWGTIVVPFNVNGIGADYDLYTLFAMDEYNLTLIKFDGTLPAGTPVIFRLHDDLAGNYSLTLTASNTTVSGQFNEGSEANGLQLVGTYETTELDINDYFISNNQFWRVYDAWAAAWGVKVAPFRAYLKRTWADSNARVLSIKVEEGTLTAIDALDAINEGAAEYYDTNGRRINSLQKGVNIVKYGNGKTIKVNIK